MDEPGIIFSDVSPLGNVSAQVEDDGRVVYFYLAFFQNGQDEPEEMKACWVRNRAPAPDSIDKDGVKEGLPPLMPRRSCRHPQGQPALNADDLRVIWFEEGGGAALVESNQILAVIPQWSGYEGFRGFARDCTGESAIAWQLAEDNELHARVRRAEEYWKLWDDEDFWGNYSARLIEPLEAALGRHTKYYAIDGDKFPPKALLRFDLPERYILVTVGVSLLPQPGCEMVTDDPSSIRRIELAASIDRNCPVEQVKRFGSYLSGQSCYPWSAWTWLGNGHSVDCDTPQYCGGNKFPAALLSSRMPGTPTIKWPSFLGDPMNLLWYVPITEAEREWARANDTDSLIDDLIKSGVDVTIRARRELNLS